MRSEPAEARGAGLVIDRADAPPAAPAARDKRARILSAAAGLIVTNGLEFPVSRIARDSGVAVGSIYNYFPSKQDLILGVYQQLADQIICALTAAPTDRPDIPAAPDSGNAGDAGARVLRYLRNYVDFFWADADRAVLFEYLSNVPLIATPEIAEVFRPLRTYNNALFTEAQAQGILKPLDPRSMAGFAGGGIRNALKWHRASSRPLTAEKKDDILRMCWSAIAADPTRFPDAA
ncbi:TetR/AcrR family transcriptional regulator [Pseudooceanicola aestuarii]|uniref:TetR/AcrR family transcriptional regulator n=1 Tax=Pseudooceanicola aestuarii TaxID=2697319 RepID=UPI0013D5D2F1|nr:TetR/AcrR family transcriptional regulator [Pseudooceanicola aestuarii]